MKNKIVQSISLLIIALVVLSSCNQKKNEKVVEIEPKTETFVLAKAQLTTNLRLPAELSSFNQVDLFA